MSNLLKITGSLFFISITINIQAKAQKPALILLHGCNQTANIIQEGTGFQAQSDKHHFELILPEQNLNFNLDRCWNWFLPINQYRIPYNEAGLIVTKLLEKIKYKVIDPNRIYVAGLSAGAVMAHTLAVCYPDVFTGVALHSGLPFASATTPLEAQNILLNANWVDKSKILNAAKNCHVRINSSQNKLKKMLIIHGDQDKRVLADHTTVIESVTKKLFPQIQIQTKLIAGLGHAWAGGVPISENFDPDFESSTDQIIRFFNLVQKH